VQASAPATARQQLAATVLPQMLAGGVSLEEAALAALDLADAILAAEKAVRPSPGGDAPAVDAEPTVDFSDPRLYRDDV
jgi:hypothetical protein